MSILVQVFRTVLSHEEMSQFTAMRFQPCHAKLVEKVL